MRLIGRMFWALLIKFFSGFPDLLRDAQPGTAKERVGFSAGFSRGLFYTSHFVTKSTQLCPLAHDLGLGIQVRRCKVASIALGV